MTNNSNLHRQQQAVINDMKQDLVKAAVAENNAYRKQLALAQQPKPSFFSFPRFADSLTRGLLAMAGGRQRVAVAGPRGDLINALNNSYDSSR